MLVTRLLKLLKFDLSGEKMLHPLLTSIVLFLRGYIQESAPISPPPVIPPFASGSSFADSGPFAPFSAQLQDLSLNINTQFEKISTREDEYRQEYRNDMAHIYSSIRYLQNCVDESFNRHAWPATLPSGYAQPLPTMGPPFDLCVPPSAPFRASAPPVDPDFPAEEEED